MEIRSGIDIVHQQRFSDKIRQNPDILARAFHPSEISLSATHSLAGMFAVKEAIFKALDKKEKDWLGIEISYRKSGKPEARIFNESEYGIKSLDISISHDHDYIVGMASILIQNQ